MKQAVVLIHGIGEQVPMDTLGKLVEAVWTTDDQVRRTQAPSTIWSKPDEVSENYELRRLTTAEAKNGKCTDFFELYWADLMKDTKLIHTWHWVGGLLFRNPKRLPRHIVPLWGLLVFATLCGVGGVIAYQLASPAEDASVKWKVAGAVAGVVWLFLNGLLVNVLGDAARYLRVAPENLCRRKEIRDVGIRLLDKLQTGKKYDRIIVVAHSLGTVVGYDIINHLWSRYNVTHAYKAGSVEALQELEKLAREAVAKAKELEAATQLPKPRSSKEQEDARLAEEQAKSAFVAAYQAAQLKLIKEMAARENLWRITDFITLGSPLAHADVLLGRDQAEFDRKVAQREFPTCPPQLDKGESFSYHPRKKLDALVPDHGAPFSAVRWTNLYFPVSNVFWGDLVGGPVGRVFGPGVKDVAVGGDKRPFFAHTHYWDVEKDIGQIADLRKALDLAGPGVK